MVAVCSLERTSSGRHWVAERISDGLEERLRRSYGKEIWGSFAHQKLGYGVRGVVGREAPASRLQQDK